MLRNRKNAAFKLTIYHWPDLDCSAKTKVYEMEFKTVFIDCIAGGDDRCVFSASTPG
jgi:hypothetical protein